VRWIKEGQAGADFAAKPEATIEYTGAEVILKQP
jgi:hypothetical protein